MAERLKFIKTYWRMRKQVREENKKVNVFLRSFEVFYCSESNRSVFFIKWVAEVVSLEVFVAGSKGLKSLLVSYRLIDLQSIAGAKTFAIAFLRFY